MPELKKTHRLVNSPRISARYLADYMAASEVARRTILVSAKYQPIARVLQHDEAKQSVSKFFRSANPDPATLTAAAQKIRERMADTDFDRDLFDHNADYLDRVAKVAGEITLPDASILAPGTNPSVMIAGVRVSVDIQFRLRRLTKTNKVRLGVAALRYAKGRPLKEETGAWQSAFLFDYLRGHPFEEGGEPEHKLCLTVDAYAGVLHPAPGDSASRYKNMEAACAAIAERWEKIPPPPRAVL